MSWNRRLQCLGVAFAGLTVATGCALLEPKRSKDGLLQVRTPGPGSLYISDVRHPYFYDDVVVASIGLDYASGQRPLVEADEARLYELMQGALASMLAGRGQAIAPQPGPCTLKMSLYLANLELFETDRYGAQTNFVDSYGAVTLVTDLRESLTDAPVMRYGQRRGLGGGVEGGRVRPDTQRLEALLKVAMSDARNAMRMELPVPGPATGALASCEGRIGKARKALPER